MNGYSKINVTTGSSHKSRSIDFSDMFSSFSQTPKQSKISTSDDDDDESGKGEQFGVILGRSTSVSSSGGLMKRTIFSVRRSSSVSERYCRIHDHYNINNNGDHDTTTDVTRVKKHRGGGGGGKILRACKRFLRF